MDEIGNSSVTADTAVNLVSTITIVKVEKRELRQVEVSKAGLETCKVLQTRLPRRYFPKISENDTFNSKT